MTHRTLAIWAACLALAVSSTASFAAINLVNVGISTGPVLGIDPGTGGGGIDGGGGISPPPPPPPPPTPQVYQLEAQGYVCTDGNLAATECRRCSFEPVGETYSCRVYLCSQSGNCSKSRTRPQVPMSVDTDALDLWALEFAFGADPYFLSDVDRDGAVDLVGDKGSTHVAFSEDVFFLDAGIQAVNTPIESEGPMAIFDVNRDGRPDVLSVSQNGHLAVTIATGLGSLQEVELTGTWCEGLGTCLIGDVNGDGFPDLVEVMRGAVGGQRAGDVWVSLGYETPGFPVLPAPPAAVDSDGDGIADRDDNCIEVANPAQLDGDGDQRGNACDPDLDNDGVVTSTDFFLFRACLGATVATRPECAAMDFDEDGVVSSADYFGTMRPAMNGAPGLAAVDLAPELELFTPTDGTIYETGTQAAWVAGWVPNLPVGDVIVRIDGQEVPVTGSDNSFSVFVPISLGSGRLFQSILIEAERASDGQLDVERRSVLVGERVGPGARGAGAVGAQLTSAAVSRLEEYLELVVLPDELDSAAAGANGYTADPGCKYWFVCWDGYTIRNAAFTGAPSVDIGLGSQEIRADIRLPDLAFDYTVHMNGPNCGESAVARNIRVQLAYDAHVDNGRVILREQHDPIVSTDIAVSGCGGGEVRSSIRDTLFGAFNDIDDRPSSGQFGSIPGPVSGPIQDLFANLSATRVLDLAGQNATEPEDVESRLRFESIDVRSSGVAGWAELGLTSLQPEPGFGGLDGAFQLPGFQVPSTLPSSLPSGKPYHVGAALTPNGLNTALDALTRAGFLAGQTVSIEEDINGLVLAAVFGLSELFQMPDPSERMVIELGWAPGVPRQHAPAPVVSGNRGPGGEDVDLHIAQLPVEVTTLSGEPVLSLLLDLRAGVDATLSRSAAGKIFAIARSIEILDFGITANPFGVDADTVARRVLCIGHTPTSSEPCLVDGRLEGFAEILEEVEIPLIEKPGDPETFELAPKCLERLDDGTLLAQFGLLLPGEELPASLPIRDVTFTSECAPPLQVDPGTATGGSSGTGSTGGSTGSLGGFDFGGFNLF